MNSLSALSALAPNQPKFGKLFRGMPSGGDARQKDSGDFAFKAETLLSSALDDFVERYHARGDRHDMQLFARGVRNEKDEVQVGVGIRVHNGDEFVLAHTGVESDLVKTVEPGADYSSIVSDEKLLRLVNAAELIDASRIGEDGKAATIPLTKAVNG